MTEEKKIQKPKTTSTRKSVEKKTKAVVSIKKTVDKATEKLLKVEKEMRKEPMNNMFTGKYYYANGKRKTSIARVRLYEKGNGEIVVNGKPYDEYFKIGTLFGLIKSPLKLIGIKDFSITAKIEGGGVTAQADALRHGIAKAISAMQTESHVTLKKDKQLTRDSRKVERKKPGKKKARKAQQWVKR